MSCCLLIHPSMLLLFASHSPDLLLFQLKRQLIAYLHTHTHRLLGPGGELIAHAGRLCSHIFHKLRIRHVKRLARTQRGQHTLRVTAKSAPSALSGRAGQVAAAAAPCLGFRHSLVAPFVITQLLFIHTNRNTEKKEGLGSGIYSEPLRKMRIHSRLF